MQVRTYFVTIIQQWIILIIKYKANKTILLHSLYFFIHKSPINFKTNLLILSGLFYTLILFPSRNSYKLKKYSLGGSVSFFLHMWDDGVLTLEHLESIDLPLF